MRIPRCRLASLAGVALLLAAWWDGVEPAGRVFPAGDAGPAPVQTPQPVQSPAPPAPAPHGVATAAVPAEDPEPSTLRIQVVREFVVDEDSWECRSVPDVEVEITGADGRVHRLRTDAEGEALLPAPEGPVLVVARDAKGIGTERCEKVPSFLGICLKPAEVLHGTVATMDGTAIPGAEVVVWSEPFGSEDDYLLLTPEGWPPLAAFSFSRARTDDAGNCELLVPEDAYTFFVTAAAPGRSPTGLKVQNCDLRAGRTVGLWLPEAATVRGTVSDPVGGPASGARVRLVPGDAIVSTNGKIHPWMDHPVVRETTADALGRYAFEDAPADASFHLVALREDLGATELARDLWIPVAGGTLRKDLEFRAAGRVVVRTTEDGAVLVDEEGWKWEMAGRWSEEEGEWTFERADLPPGTYRVRVGGKGEFRLTGESFQVHGDGCEERRVEPVPRVSISGRILDEEGRPVAGLRIWAWRCSYTGPYEEESGEEQETDEEGFFAIPGLLPGPHDLRSDCGDRTSLLAGALAAPAADLEFRIPASGRLRFRLDLPVGDEGPGEVQFVVQWRDGEGVECEWTGEETPAEEGFDLGGIGPGPGRVVVFVPGFAPLVEEYDLEAGTILDLGCLHPVPGRTITGRVVDDLGAPLAGADVYLELFGDQRPRVDGDGETDEEGRFVLRNAPPGEVRLVAWGQVECMEGRATAGPEDTHREVVLVLPRPAWVRGRLLAPSGRPLSTSVAFFRGLPGDGEGDSEDASSDARGWYGLWLAPGIVHPGVVGPDGEWMDLGPLDLRPGEVRTLDLVVPE